MIAFLIMIPALLFMAGILAIAVLFAENDDSTSSQAAMLLAERQSSKCFVASGIGPATQA